MNKNIKKNLKKVLCPNINTLKLYKVFPKIDDFHYLRYQFYIYIYVDPFSPLRTPLTIKTLKNKEHCIAYTPIYIGKASRGFGYRHNQHIASYKTGIENNPEKNKKFKELEDKFSLAKNSTNPDHKNLPHSWEEYQLNWITILEEFDNKDDLLEYEVNLIKQLGTVYTKTGIINTLVNKIEN